MANVKIVSNPYTREISYYSRKNEQHEWEDIRTGNSDSHLRKDDTGRAFLPFKIKEIIDIIIDEYYVNGEVINIEFEGTQDEYNEVAAVCRNDGVMSKISLSRSDNILENARLIFQPTKDVFASVQPIIEKIIKDDANVTKKLNKVSDALKDKIPICVFGNYSAGKSTFINALIGSEVLPSGGDPVTAKVYKIERSQNDDIARIKFSYLSEKFEILFEGNSYRILKGNAENELILSIDEAIENLKNKDMFSQINAALELINAYEKKDRDVIVISNVISLEIPFSKNGILGQSYNNFVIFDTPGSNSSSNIEHSAVLAEALEGFSNGIPVWVSTYESVDSTDNASLCDKILNIPALDKRFTMIVLNKADGSDLDEDGFSKKKEQQILEYASVEKMYASGIYFVSSIMGIGAKNDGKLIDNHYRRIFRSQQEMYSDPEDEDYATLYRYNIMPEQIKAKVIEYCESLSKTPSDLIYANSGLYCIENEIENFASKYAAYNKCQMVYMFLNEVIDETNSRIATRTESLKRTREARQRELDAAKAKLIDELNVTSQKASFEYEKDSKQFIRDFASNKLNYTYPIEALSKNADELHAIVEPKYNVNLLRNELELNHGNLIADMKNISKDNISKSLKNILDDKVEEAKRRKEIKEKIDKLEKEIDKEVSDALMEIVVGEYKKSVMAAKDILTLSIRDHWMMNTQTLRNTLITIITGTDALSSTQREELSTIIMNYQPPEFNDDADSVFIKAKFLNGVVFGIRIGDSERLNLKRLSNIYNDKIKKTINEMATDINESCNSSFKSWKNNLSAVIEENITEYNPQLRDMSDMIREETEKIAELENDQNKICEALESIKELMAWKIIE